MGHVICACVGSTVSLLQHCARGGCIAMVGVLHTAGSTVPRCQHCTLVEALYSVPWWQHCAMVAALCPGGSTVPWWQHCSMVAAHCAMVAAHCFKVAALCQGGSTVPWWQHSALVSALEGYSPRNPSCPPKVMTSWWRSEVRMQFRQWAGSRGWRSYQPRWRGMRSVGGATDQWSPATHKKSCLKNQA